MSRSAAFALVAALSLCLAVCVSCGGKEAEAPSAMAPAPAAPAPPPAPEEPPTSGQEGELIGELGFVSDGHLRVVDIASGKVRDLVATGAVQGFDWSPDGSEVAIATSGYPPVIKRMPVEGGEGEPIGQAGLGGTDPRWSPSGDALAFVVHDSDVGSSVHLVSLIEGSSPESAGESEASPLAPEAPTFRVGINPIWSPDGRWLVYEREGAIRMLTADGSRETQVSLGVTRCALGSWSPDAQRVGYSGLDRAATGTSIFASSASDSARGQSVTRGGRDDVLPAWSPDGATIAFLRPVPAHEAAAPESTPGESETGFGGAVPSTGSEEQATPTPMALWVVDAVSGRERQISEELMLLVQPCWSPDGAWLAYMAPGSSETMQRLMVCSLDGAVVKQLAEAPGIRSVSWRPKAGDGAED